MEQDQEDFDTWDASELDQIALDIFGGNPDLFGNDGHPNLSNQADGLVPTSSIALAESANPNIESIDLLPSLDEYNDFNPFWNPSKLPAPTQATSSMQVAQPATPTDDEIFRLVNLDADASYTDQHPSESFAPIATADCVAVAKSTDLTGNDMFHYNQMDLDASYADIDPSQLLAPTTNTGFVQATQSTDLMEGGTSRIIELDPDPIMAPSGPAPTSSEQLPPPVSTDRVFPAEVAQSANPMTNFNGPSSSSNLASHPPPLAYPSNEMITTMSTPGKQLQSQMGNSLASREYVPIQPKPAPISRSTELPSTSEPQDSIVLRPSPGTLALRSVASVSKGKRKRPRPSNIPKGIPKECFDMFQTIGNSEAAKEEQQQQPVTKRIRSDRTCLRCQVHRKKCSGRFPCENCAIHFADRATKISKRTIHWKSCFDSNIMQHKFFSEFSNLLFLLRRVLQSF